MFSRFHATPSFSWIPFQDCELEPICLSLQRVTFRRPVKGGSEFLVLEKKPLPCYEKSR